jgi:hypothetical protein
LKDVPKVDQKELFMESIEKLPKNELAQEFLRDVNFNPQTLIEIDGFK